MALLFNFDTSEFFYIKVNSGLWMMIFRNTIKDTLLILGICFATAVLSGYICCLIFGFCFLNCKKNYRGIEFKGLKVVTMMKNMMMRMMLLTRAVGRDF